MNIFNSSLDDKLNKIQRTNSLDDIHIFDSRFTALNQGGHSNTLTLIQQDVNDSGNVNWLMPATATLLSIVSDDDEDGDVGMTGINIIAIQGLDQNFNEIQEVVVLSGQTPVLTTKSYRAMNLSIAGLGGLPGLGAVGNITISSNDDGQVFGRYVEGDTTCEVGRYTVPRNKRFLLQRTLFLTGADADVESVLEITILNSFPVQLGVVPLGDGTSANIPLLPIFLDTGTTMKFRARTENVGGPSSKKISTPFAGLLAEIGAWESLKIL